MDFQNKRRPAARRDYANQYGPRPLPGQSPSSKEPDIIQIWEQQRRMREREAQLEREYEAAKRHVKDLQIKMKQNAGLLSDVSDLQTTVREDAVRGVKNSRLWIGKTYKKIKVKAEGFYVKTRFRLGIPIGNRSSFIREKALMAGLAVLVVGAGLVYSSQDKNGNQTAVQGQSQIAGNPVQLNQKPEFNLLTPDGKGAEAVGGFAKINPPQSDPVYAYADEIEGIKFRVSQQQTPGNIKSSPDGLEKMATDFNAKRTLEVDGTTIYIGQSVSGPQSLLFIEDGLLVLITSDGEISDAVWKTYISTLKI